MGSIIRTAANNVGASGVFSSSAFNNASLNSVTSLPTAVDGKMKLISSQTASGDASLSFTSGIDSTYKTYCFKFIDIHPASDGAEYTFNGSTDGGSNYNVTKTSTMFYSAHTEADDFAGIGFFNPSSTRGALAQQTIYQALTENTGNGADESCSGELWLFNPSSTTYVKHFISTVHSYEMDNNAQTWRVAGYFNTTSAINAIDFQFNSGNIDDGTIALYGIA